MGVSSAWLLLLMAGFYGAFARGITFLELFAFLNQPCIAGSPYIAAVIDNDNEEDSTLTPNSNYNGWVNPEDLAPMPQCIAQQDHSTWLTAMTECTAKQCTSHFAFICTHHQWLTELSCLSTEFSPDLLKGYLPYCSRSVLSKAQLYLWIWNITSRTWLVDVGDANGLQNLSPASLIEGYADLDVTNHAPTCLTDSVSAQSREPYQHVMASCMFTSSAQNTGDAARPWEYSESLQSMITLGFETVGYNNLTRSSIADGNHFDKDCFCSSFAIDPENEPCLESGAIDLTKKRLWINATCGSTSLPDNWTDTLQTTEFRYIPKEDWYWPTCVADMPKQVTELPDRCAADACELDSDGYCSKVKPSVDRACFCHNISYDSCGGSCQVFEGRIDYIKWLRDTCGGVEDWRGLPDNWRQLAAPTSRDMIPWGWTIKPSKGSNCSSNRWKLGSFALVNITTFLAMALSQRTRIRQIARDFLGHHRRPQSWYSKGALIAALQILASYINALLVRRTPGYEDVPVTQLMLLWCSMPRVLAWLPVLLVGIQPLETMNISAAVSCLFAEAILQGFASYYMAMTVKYGLEHNFYFGGVMGRAERGAAARMMYTGAVMWLAIIGLALFQSIRAAGRMNRMTEDGSLEPPPKTQRDRKAISRIADGVMVQLNERYTRFREKLLLLWMIECGDSEETRPIRSKGRDGSVYGTFPSTGRDGHWVSHKKSVGLYATLTFGMIILWLAQWLFWSGFIVLSSEEYVLIPPSQLSLLGAYWLTGLT